MKPRLAQVIEKWSRMPDGRRETFAFKASGCEVAYPTWWVREDGTNERVDCAHLGCRIRRREFRRPAWLVRFTAYFRNELSNWLRFAKETPEGRRAIASIYWEMKRKRRFDIMPCVAIGVLA